MSKQLMKRLYACAASLSVAAGASAISTTSSLAQVNEIVVTAQKREQLLSDVPIAVSAYSSDQLQKSGVTDLRSLMSLSPGLVTTSTDSETDGTTFRLRGIGTTGQNIGIEGAVGVFLDGIYISRAGIALTDLPDVERIEVLRGPQGTLFGRNTSAGTINVITKAPEHEFGGMAEATYGNYDYVNIKGAVTGPVAEDVLAVRLSASYTMRDGFIDDLVTGQDYNDRDRWGLRGSFLLTPNDDVSLRVTADYAEADESCCAAVTRSDLGGISLIQGALGAAFVAPAKPFARKAAYNSPFTQNVDNWGISGELNWDLNETITMTTILSYRDWDAFQQSDVDFTNLDILNRNGRNDGVETFSAEMRFNGQFDRVNWLVGGYYADEALRRSEDFSFGADTELFLNTTLNALSGGAWIGILGGYSGLTGLAPGTVFPDGAGAVSSILNQDGEQWALFTHNVIDVTDDLRLTAGVRYTEETKKATGTMTTINPGCSAMLPIAAGFPMASPLFPLVAQAAGAACLPLWGPVPDFGGKRKETEWSGTVKLDYDLTEEVIAYASASRGYKGGGFNLDRTAALGGANPQFKGEFVNSYEAGIRGIFLDNRLAMNGAVFYAKYKDFQLLTFNGVQFITENVSKVDTMGAELDFQASLAEGFDVFGGVSYTEAEYGNGVAAPLTGRQITNAPKWVFTGGATYTRPIGNSGLDGFLHSDFRFDSGANTGSNLDPRKIQDDYIVVNLRGGVSFDDGRWELEGWARNVLDQNYIQVAFDQPLTTLASPSTINAFLAEPRTYGVTGRLNF